MYIATKALSHEDYGIIALIGLLYMWRINIIEKTWPSMYCFIVISLFSVPLWLNRHCKS